jgi:hypothetical protein
MREHDNEPIPGLPERLPSGESILWQGKPSWWGIATHALHIRGVAIYLALIVLWGTTSAIANHLPAVGVAIFALKLVGLSAVALFALAFYARLVAESAMYTLTNRRVVMRFGVALPMTMNIPLKTILSADFKVYPNGSGNIALAVSSDRRQSIVVLWPHVRPWRTRKPEPMLRSISDAAGVAQILASALNSISTERSEIRVRLPRRSIIKSKPVSASDQIAAA